MKTTESKPRLFENDVTITGSHATHLKFLVDETKLFKKYIDVYLCAAVFGYLYGCKAEKDNESSDRARIYADAISNRRDTCILLYRLITLLDDSEVELSVDERVNRAFRYDADPEKSEETKNNLETFNAYVRGGIEYMYDKFAKGASGKEEYIRQSFMVVKNFKDEIEGVSYEEKIKQLLGR